MDFYSVSSSRPHDLTENLFFTQLNSYYMENNTWVRGNTRFISSVERDISRVSAANE